MVTGWCYCLCEAGAPSCGVYSPCTGAVRASLGVQVKKGGCSSWWASAGPQDTCCWPLFPQTIANNMRGPSCVSWKALCEVNRWRLKEDTLLCMKITAFLWSEQSTDWTRSVTGSREASERSKVKEKASSTGPSLGWMDGWMLKGKRRL